MEQNERELFAKALLEGITNKCNRELAECEEEFNCSASHLRKVSRIIGVNVKHRERHQHYNRKRAFIAIILAAALLLSVVTVYAYRNEIRDLIQTVYEKFVHVTYDDNGARSNCQTITEVYELSYIPEGYELTEKRERPVLVSYKWESDNGKVIVFEQYIFESTNFGFDNEKGEVDIKEYGVYRILIQNYDSTVHYLWNDGKYAMKIIATDQFAEEELFEIIDGVTVKE